MIKKKAVLASRASVVAAVVALHANVAYAVDSGITLTPGVGYMDYDSDRSTRADDLNMVLNPGEYDDDAFYSFGVGYRWDSPWQVEVVYADGDTGTPAGDIDFSQIRLDGLYHLATDNSVVPYLVLGGGQNEFDEPGSGPSAGSRRESIVNYGAGIKYAFNDVLSLRSDIRGVTSLDEEDTDLAFFLGAQFKLGFGSERAAPAPAPVVEETGPVDSDGDGVVDEQDDCPSTASGVEVDGNGCALDDDNDGVSNHRDECPDTEAGAKVDSQGCYITLTETKEIELNVNFPNNSSIIDSEYLAEIEKVADFMAAYPQTNTVIEGHTDSGGAADYNQQLSERRASKVMDVLVETYGVDEGRVSAVGYGEEKPIASNDSAAGRSENRRVVAVISATVEKRAE